MTAVKNQYSPLALPSRLCSVTHCIQLVIRRVGINTYMVDEAQPDRLARWDLLYMHTRFTARGERACTLVTVGEETRKRPFIFRGQLMFDIGEISFTGPYRETGSDEPAPRLPQERHEAGLDTRYSHSISLGALRPPKEQSRITRNG